MEDVFTDDLVGRLEEHSYPSEYPEPTVDSIEAFRELSPDGQTEVIGGRVERFDSFGGIMFGDITDSSGGVQFVFERDVTSQYDELEDSILVGDIVVFVGEPSVYGDDEFSILVHDWTVVTQTLQSSVSDGLVDGEEMRQRTALMRYTDFYQTVQTRFDVFREVREFLWECEFTEVQTPILHHNPTGGDATPFETTVEALDETQYLRVAPELYLKRLLVGGFEQVFEVARVFRNEDIDRTHNPEFTMLEAYGSFMDYNDMATLTENLVCSVLESTNDASISYGDGELDFSTSWRRLRFFEALREVGGHEVLDYSTAELRESIRREGGEIPEPFTRGDAYVELFEETVEGELFQPTIIFDYPVESTPLCERTDSDESTVERFEAFVGGVEIANGYTELRDPIEQAGRMEEQGVADYDFIRDLAYGMPPAGGVGIGLDRLVMFATEEESLRDGITFPTVSRS